MSKPDSRLAYLFGCYVMNTLTETERGEFMEMTRQESYLEELNLLIAETIQNAGADREMNPGSADRLFEMIIQGGSKGVMAPVVPIKKKNYFGWVAAASIIVLVVGAYFLFPGGNKKQVLTAGNAARKNEIIPAGNKAILTLDNGSTIVLDSASDGTLARQGNTDIIKLNGGRLAYQVGASAAAGGGEVAYNTIHTPRGGQYQVVLPDGTAVWLNTASSIRFPTRFTGGKREVTLTGEAYFEIAKNKSMPFIVSVRQTAVKVLGTHFNINGYEDEGAISTTLLEGAVAFSSGGADKVLRPGQQAVYGNSSRSVLVQEADVNQVMGWKNGFFEFDNVDLPTIMRQISRWYDVDVVYGVTDKDIKLGGGISRKSSLQDLIRLLETNGIHCKVDGRKLIVNT